MKNKLTLQKSVTIKASAPAVWKTLTDPALIKEYFFGTNTFTDWKKGSPIVFRGEWEGKTYEDKGTILDVEPGKYVRYNYWSSLSDTEDIPENYANISYELTPAAAGTTLTIIQDGIETQEKLDHSNATWDMVLDGLEKLAEKIDVG